MDKDRASELHKKYLQGKCTPEEERLLFNAFNHVNLPAGEKLTEEAFEQHLNSSLESIHNEINQKEKQLIPRWVFGAAAVALIGLLISVYFFLNNSDQGDDPMMVSEILPGGNRAMLIVADSEPLLLDSNQSAIISDGEQFMYADRTPVNGWKQGRDSSLPLVLTTPNGGTYQVTLSDGTNVWLNAASQLKYPSRFVGNERIVEVSGEAYFSVARDTERPFRVITDGQAIEVLGTEFNVSAYRDENVTRTTLITGSVRLQLDSSAETMSLDPGEQAIAKEGSISKRSVDAEGVVAWKDGYFKLNGTLRDIMAQVGRWYNIDVVFQSQTDANLEFFGEISRDVNLSEILRMINEIDNGLKFKVEEVLHSVEEGTIHQKKRRVTVMR